MALLSDTTQPITANGDYDVVLQEPHMNINIGGTWATAQIDILEVNRIDDTEVAAVTGGAAIVANFTDIYHGAKGVTVRFTVSGATGGESLTISTLPSRG